MEVAEIKKELIEIIDHANDEQLERLHFLMLNYFSEETELTGYQKEQIEISLQQANAGLGRPAAEVLQEIRTKYGLI